MKNISIDYPSLLKILYDLSIELLSYSPRYIFKNFSLTFLFFENLLDLFAKYYASQFGKRFFVVVFILVVTICRAITQHKKISTKS